MIVRIKKIFLITAIIFISIRCKESYEPVIRSSDRNVLVVEGVLNSDGITTIFLSRVVSLNAKVKKQPELKAKLTIEKDDKSSFALTEVGNGRYSVQKQPISNTSKYRLKIITSAGSEFVSDFVPVNYNPPIDSVGWKKTANEGVQIYVNNKDPSNRSKYYRWETEETWEIHADNYAELKIVATPIAGGGLRYTIIPIDPNNYPYQNICWRSENSKEIWLENTTQLNQAIIFERPITFIPKDDRKLSNKLSVLVKQYSLSKESYDYWQTIQKNSEDVGGMFSAQPSETKGNIHSISNSTEAVIGYFEACNITEKRIFISNKNFFDWNYIPPCKLLGGDFSMIHDVYKDWTILYWLDQTTKASFYFTQPECVDCSLEGSPVKPTFWK